MKTLTFVDPPKNLGLYLYCCFLLVCRVLQESLCAVNTTTATTGGSPTSEDDDDDGGFKYIDPDLALALRLSQQDQQQYELERQMEQDMIEQALKLSLQDH